MRHHNFTAFDEFIVGAGNTVTTSTELNSRLAHFDQLAIMAVVDNINATGTFALTIEHSADGRNWTGWSGGSADLTMSSLLTNANNVGVCTVPSGSNTSPLLSFVRFSMVFTTTARGHVRIAVTQRDQGG